MERGGWQVLAALTVMAMLGVPDIAAAQGDGGNRNGTPSIMVRVDDKAGVQGALLKLAKARAAEVFALRGVQLNWIDGKEASRLKITTPYWIVIMAEAPAKVKAAMEQLGTEVMGQGAPVIGRAYIYYDRVVAFRPVPPRDIPSTLGDVMAHELGHLMLPPGHSPVGIMRPTINMRSRRVETFTETEADVIRARVSATALSTDVTAAEDPSTPFDNVRETR